MTSSHTPTLLDWLGRILALNHAGESHSVTGERHRNLKGKGGGGLPPSRAAEHRDPLQLIQSLNLSCMTMFPGEDPRAEPKRCSAPVRADDRHCSTATRGAISTHLAGRGKLQPHRPSSQGVCPAECACAPARRRWRLPPRRRLCAELELGGRGPAAETHRRRDPWSGCVRRTGGTARSRFRPRRPRVELCSKGHSTQRLPPPHRDKAPGDSERERAGSAAAVEPY
jgi:hypothetical protein